MRKIMVVVKENDVILGEWFCEVPKNADGLDIYALFNKSSYIGPLVTRRNFANIPNEKEKSCVKEEV